MGGGQGRLRSGAWGLGRIGLRWDGLELVATRSGADLSGGCNVCARGMCDKSEGLEEHGAGIGVGRARAGMGGLGCGKRIGCEMV